MAAEAAAMLDELMGKYRNAAPGEVAEQHWSDPEFCRYHLSGLCPHDLFSNTKSDLGPCDKEHNDKMKEAYEKSSRYGRYDEKHLAYLEDLVAQLDRRIQSSNARLQTPGIIDPLEAERQEKADQIGKEIETMLTEMNRLGEEGKVDQSQALMQRVELMKRQQQDILNPRPGPGEKIKEMVLCAICGSKLIVGEPHDSHMAGKQHLGYAAMRDKIAEYKEKVRKAREDRNSSTSRREDKAPDADKDKDRERNRDRDRDRDRDRARSDRDRERERDRRDRYSSSSRRERSRSRDRSRR